MRASRTARGTSKTYDLSALHTITNRRCKFREVPISGYAAEVMVYFNKVSVSAAPFGRYDCAVCGCNHWLAIICGNIDCRMVAPLAGERVATIAEAVCHTPVGWEEDA